MDRRAQPLARIGRLMQLGQGALQLGGALRDALFEGLIMLPDRAARDLHVVGHVAYRIMSVVATEYPSHSIQSLHSARRRRLHIRLG